MRISVNWLRELVDFSLSPEELSETLTIAGIEVEGIEDRRHLADGVVVGKILQREPHPNANKLSVCQVDIGQPTPSTIVCGAANAQANIYVPVATPGTYLPAVDLKIKPAKLRGVRSEGMICSLAELGLAKESEGIHIFLEADLELGADVRPLLGLDDVILEISPTANRADALSMVGVAREVAALTGATLKLPLPPNLTFKEKPTELIISVSDSRACPAYIGTVIEGVKIAASPLWLQRRLEAAGVRPINNVVDITNLVLLEWGQPLHAFDRESLKVFAGSEQLQIGVRFAEKDESLKTLDGQTRNLTSQNLLITANQHPVAIAGVMGGEETEVTSQTQNIVLEAALFEPITIRRSARMQGLRTESSARYERGVNQVELELACGRAIALITKLAGGKVIHQVSADTRPKQYSNSIQLRLARLHQVLGSVKQGQIQSSDVERILSDLGCQLASVEPGVWQVTVPSYRYRDLEREIDLIEEVARLYGYDNFCETLPKKTSPGGLSASEKAQRQIREAFRAIGLTELVQYSLVKPEKNEVVLANPLLAEYSALRTNLLDGLIDAFEYNQAQGNGALNGFEIGRIFWQEDTQVAEADTLAGIFGGTLAPMGQWTSGGKPTPMTWYEAKGVLESAFQRLGVTVEYRQDSEDKRLHPGRTASLWLGEQSLGRFGQIHPQLRQQRGLIDAVYGFELYLGVLLDSVLKQEQIFRPYSPYPSVARDLAFFAPQELSVGNLSRLMHQAGSPLLAKVELFDEYQGKNVPAGQRSLAFSLAYQASDRTLTDQEVEPVHTKVREALVKEFQVTLRS